LHHKTYRNTATRAAKPQNKWKTSRKSQTKNGKAAKNGPVGLPSRRTTFKIPIRQGTDETPSDSSQVTGGIGLVAAAQQLFLLPQDARNMDLPVAGVIDHALCSMNVHLLEQTPPEHISGFVFLGRIQLSGFVRHHPSFCLCGIA
jgi:hypothetical protein